MNDMNVQNLTSAQAYLERLSLCLATLPTELRKAAEWVLENPQRVAIMSARQIATACDVKPNTLVRLARTLDCSGFEDFKSAFIEDVERGPLDFPDRARWLQSLSAGGKMNRLFADLAESAIDNIEQTFASLHAKDLKDAAKLIRTARRAYIMGVGINNTLARNFVYLGDMGFQNMQAIPREGALAQEDLARATSDDVLLAITFQPYRAEVLEAVSLAKSRGLKVVAISDSAAAPIFAEAEIRFVVQTESPQFFSSTFSTIALLEALMAFIIADAGPEVIANIDAFNKHRHQLGLYVNKMYPSLGDSD